MTLSLVELRAQTRISRAFIAADAISVELSRPTEVSDGAGGRSRTGFTTLPPQTFRLLPQEDGATARTTAEGETATPEYMLMGAPDVDVARFDEFQIGDRRYQVVYIDNRQYEVKAEVIYLGE